MFIEHRILFTTECVDEAD